jgi:hypothetical protein
VNAIDAGEAVESRIEGQNSLDFVPLHDGNVDRIAGRQSFRRAQEAARPLDVLELDRVDDIDDTEEGIERGFDRITSPDCGESVKEFLKDIRVGC